MERSGAGRGGTGKKSEVPWQGSGRERGGGGEVHNATTEEGERERVRVRVPGRVHRRLFPLPPHPSCTLALISVHRETGIGIGQLTLPLAKLRFLCGGRTWIFSPCVVRRKMNALPRLAPIRSLTLSSFLSPWITVYASLAAIQVLPLIPIARLTLSPFPSVWIGVYFTVASYRVGGGVGVAPYVLALGGPRGWESEGDAVKPGVCLLL